MTADIDVRVRTGDEEVTIFADGQRIGSVDADWWRSWTASIDREPRECLAHCLRADDSPVPVQPRNGS